jgi:hypothetical protein
VRTLNESDIVIANFRTSNYPDAPSNLTTTAISSSQINLAWQDNSTNETGFKIERNINGGAYSQIDTVGAGITTYSNTGLSTYTVYCYRARAYNAAGDSAYSNVGCATPLIATTAAQFRVHRATGWVFSDSSLNCGLASGCFNSGTGADLAERVDVSENVQPGDVIEPDPEKSKTYRKARGTSSVAGVVSSQPGMALNNLPGKTYTRRLVPTVTTPSLTAQEWTLPLGIRIQGLLPENLLFSEKTLRISQLLSVESVTDQRPLLALIGRVPVKATTENGAIYPGDLLVVSASRPGYAMKCRDTITCEGAVVGKALGALQDGEGLILVLVMSR